MKKIKQFFTVLKIYKQIGHSAAIFEITKQIFDFINNTKEEGRPMLTHIGLINVDTGIPILDMVDLWAATGKGNPIQRLKAVINQREEWKRLALKMKNKQELDEHDIMIIHYLTIDDK